MRHTSAWGCRHTQEHSECYAQPQPVCVQVGTQSRESPWQAQAFEVGVLLRAGLQYAEQPSTQQKCSAVLCKSSLGQNESTAAT